MTREVMDALPTGRNIQAVGIMIPGTALSVGGGNALSRDVGGAGCSSRRSITRAPSIPFRRWKGCG